MKQKIPLFKIHWDDEDISAVSNIIQRGSYWATGPETLEFENKLAKYVGSDYAVAFNSGTSALHAVLLAYGIQPGDEVIVPSFTFISTANAPIFVGAKPVFAEIEDETFGLDPEDVKNKITDKTKAIIPVHYAGCPCKYKKKLLDLAIEHNLILIDDAAEALGAGIGNSKIGTSSDAAMFSFCQNKIITMGEGGIIATDSEEIFKKLKLISSHGRLENDAYFSTSGHPEYTELGYNFRMPTILAALGLSQLNKIDKLIEMRRENAELYNNKLSQIEGLITPAEPPDFLHVYQMYTIRLMNISVEKLKEYLEAKGISAKVYFDPVHLTSYYQEQFGYQEGHLPRTEEISKKVLSLPMYPDLTRSEIDYITSEIENFIKEGF